MVSLHLPCRLTLAFALLTLLGVFSHVPGQTGAAERPTGFALINARMGELPEGVPIGEWIKLIESVSGEKTNPASVILLVCRFDRFWGEGEKFDEFRLEAFRSCVARTEQLNQDVLNKLQIALKAACGEKLDKCNCVLPIVGLDHVFKGDKFNAEAFDATIKRLNLLPAESVAAWAKATDTDKTTAALFLVRFDSLFADDTFRLEAFERGLKKVSSTSTTEAK